MKKKLIIIISSCVVALLIILGIIFIPKMFTKDKVKEIQTKDYISEGKIILNDKGVPKYIEGSRINTSVKEKNDVYAALNEIKGMYGFDDAKYVFDIISTDEVGDLKYYKVQQKYNGIKVYGKQLVLAVDKNNKVLSVTGTYYDVKSVPGYLNASKALEKFNENYPDLEVLESDTYYYVNENEAMLAFIATTLSNDGYYDYVLDKDDNLVDKIDLTNYENKNVKLKNVFDEDVNINVSYNTSLGTEYYEYQDEERNILIMDGYDVGADFGTNENRKWGNFIYYLFRKNDRIPMGYTIIDGKPEFYQRNIGILYGFDNKLIDANTAMNNFKITYDYYKNVLGRTGYDNAGSGIYVFLGLKNDAYGKEEYENAAWAKGIFVFGSKNNYTFAGPLDVVAHEYTHAVTGSIIDFKYKGESGALSESYSDIMGSLVENKNFVLGEQIEEIRDMANPNKYNNPSVYKGKYYFPDDTETYNEEWIANKLKQLEEAGSPIEDYHDWDKGGVHYNSGVPNHAAYLMYDGGAFSSKEEMARVWYNSMFLLTSTATFEDCAIAVIQSAKNLGLKEEKIDIITKAFVDTKMLAESDTILSGKVTDKDTNKSVEGVLVTLTSKINPYVNYQTKTDKDGNFTFDSVPTMEYEIVFTKAKYEDLSKDLELKKETKNFDVKIQKIDEENYGEAEVVFVLDISNSMDRSDPSDIRKQIMANILYSFDSNYSFSLVTFTGVANIVNGKMSNNASDKKILMTDIFNIPNDSGTNEYSGTNGREALTQALTLFKNNDKRKYIVFLTDGDDTVFSGKTYEEIISDAKENNIRILTIGLGTEEQLNPENLIALASGTKGKYYNAGESNDLYKFNKTLLEELE